MLGLQILIDDPNQLEEIRKREAEITLERIQKILATGANVVLTTKGIDDLCLKESAEAGDWRSAYFSLANLEGEESFEASYLGTAEEVIQERISDDELILVKGTKIVNSSLIVLRGANDYMLDEMEWALSDTLSVIKRTLESGAVAPDGFGCRARSGFSNKKTHQGLEERQGIPQGLCEPHLGIDTLTRVRLVVIVDTRALDSWERQVLHEECQSHNLKFIALPPPALNAHTHLPIQLLHRIDHSSPLLAPCFPGPVQQR
ncbi:T-complex protein 1 subunit alpha [Termitomyces sp. T32_za158]|nr:T-complex protein 1 subunit alpha [Termitomyces sp. T32_za158]